MGIRVNASRCTSSRLIFAVGAVRMHRFCRSRIYRSLRSLKERNMDHRFSRHWPGKFERFKELTEDEQLIHFSATVLVTIAIALIMTPAAYHRMAEQTTISKFFVWLASWLIAAAMVPLMVGLTLEVYLLGLLVIGDPKTSLAVSTALFGVFSLLWFVFPLAMRLFHPQD
jgi:Family of unknown function (DUF6328)